MILYFLLYLVFGTTLVLGKPLRKDFRNGVSLASEFLSNPNIQNLIGGAGMGSLSCPQIICIPAHICLIRFVKTRTTTLAFRFIYKFIA